MPEKTVPIHYHPSSYSLGCQIAISAFTLSLYVSSCRTGSASSCILCSFRNDNLKRYHAFVWNNTFSQWLRKGIFSSCRLGYGLAHHLLQPFTAVQACEIPSLIAVDPPQERAVGPHLFAMWIQNRTRLQGLQTVRVHLFFLQLCGQN